jgi:VanZ family protein
MTDLLKKVWQVGAGVPASVWWSLLALYSLAIFLLSSRPIPFDTSRLPSGFDKVLHAGAFGLWASLALAATARSRPSWAWKRHAWIAAISASIYGLCDEVHQMFVPGRSADVLDWVADLTGGILAVLLWGLVAFWLQKKPE